MGSRPQPPQTLPRGPTPKRPPQRVAINNWSGFYCIGAMGGYARKTLDSGIGTLSGGFAGGTVRLQLADAASLLGVEADARLG